MIRQSKSIASSLSLVVALVGCAIDGPSDLGESTVLTADALTQTEPSGKVTSESGDETNVYVLLVRHDNRRCMAPRCGGYYVRLLNRPSEQYVSAIDESALEPSTIQQMSDAGDGELVLRGHFGLREKEFNTRPFIALEAYRGMPGVAPAKGDSFYKATFRDPPIECFIAPCPNELATLLNTNRSQAFDGFSVTRAALAFVDEAWLTERVQHDDAIVSARFVNGERFPGGYEQLLDASEVFIRLPYTDGPCLLRPIRKCEPPLLNAFTRSADRCIVPVGCVEPGICPLFVPACPTGYTLDTWTSAPNGCPAFACDPSFLTESRE